MTEGKSSSVISNQNFSFEKDLIKRISHNQLIWRSLSPFALSSSFNASQPTLPLFSDDITKRRDQLVRNVYDRLSWSDLGDYFSTLINEMDLGIVVSNLGNRYQF